MNKIKKDIARWLPYLGAVMLFLALSLFYFAPQMEGKELSMGDITQYEGMSRDIKQMQAEGDDPQWTGNAFGGMPAYMINIQYPSMLIKNWSTAAANAMGRPAVLIFLALVGFWVMMLLWGVNPLVAIVPAIAYGFSTYSILIIGAGHITKMFAFAYAPLLVGGVVYTLRGGRLFAGCMLTALFAALQIGANHPQITYYFAFVIVAVWINYLVVAIRERQMCQFAKATGVLALAAVLAVGANLSSLYYTAQHQPDTTRGGSLLSSASTGSKEASEGLDLAYATAWSYGRTESLNMFIPNLMGGSSAGGFAPNGEVADALRPYGARSLAVSLPAYWGDQPGTAGPTYLGAAALFLALLGMFLLRGRQKWWLLGVSIFAVMLAWGSNLMWFTELMFRILPAYNNFRAVSTALVVVQWSVPLLAGLVLWQLFRGEFQKPQLLRSLTWATGITAGVALLMWLLGGTMFSFSAPYDAQMGLPDDVVVAMELERASMLRADSLRSLIMVLLSAGCVWLFAAGRIKVKAMLLGLGAIVAVDMIGVDSRYLFWNDFVAPSKTEILPSEANLAIMADKEPGYRVANFAVNTFNDATTSYFHRSVGGYHGAKLSRYQDLIDHQLLRGNPEAYDMLNTKYFIVPGEEGAAPEAVLNEGANGAAWFVEDVVFATSPQEEMELLGSISTDHTAVLSVEYASKLADVKLGTGEIELVKYRPNHLVYHYTSSEWGLCIFSEIYYDKGWSAYLDGHKCDYLRADYLLRAMILPAGSHTVEWRFEAPHFDLVEGITLGFSLLILVGLVVALVAKIVGIKSLH
ncbi:MAG: hypothetical protein J6R10_05380 [Tidjanibacter sp.]|nr:hypothetical protein [Tidjanibacter sp.]